MKQDLIDWLIENPWEVPATLKLYKEQYGIHAAHNLEAAIDARKRMKEPQAVKGITEMINAGTRAIAGDDFDSGDFRPLEIQQTTKEEAVSIAKMINQGTSDILENPGISPNEAIALGRIKRDIQG